MAIKTFANQTVADIFTGSNTDAARKLSQDIQKAAKRKLDVLAAATTTQDLNALPGNRFENLKHTKPGYFSIRINDQYRLIFQFVNGDAYDVQIEGYDHTGRR